MSNPYDVERSWPDYFLEHRRRTVEMQGTYKCGELPVWTVHCPLGYLGNATVIEGDDGLILYDTGVNAEAGAHIASEIRKISDKPGQGHLLLPPPCRPLQRHIRDRRRGRRCVRGYRHLRLGQLRG